MWRLAEAGALRSRSESRPHGDRGPTRRCERAPGGPVAGLQRTVATTTKLWPSGRPLVADGFFLKEFRHVDKSKSSA